MIAIVILVFSMVSLISHGTEETIEVGVEFSENYSAQFVSSEDSDILNDNDEVTDIRSSNDEKFRDSVSTEQNACHQSSYDSSDLSDNEESSSYIANVGEDYEHELIKDNYTITFDEEVNLTALEAEASFDIHRIEIEIDEVEDIYTADQIRENDTGDRDLIGDIEEDITDVFEETINDAFPKADKFFYPTESDPGEEGDPIEITTSADIYLVKESLGFEEDNEELDMDEMVGETLRMNGIILNRVDLTVQPGHYSTYIFEIPQPYLGHLSELEEYDRDIDDYENEVYTSRDNSDGDESEILEKELRLRHEDPDVIEEEDIRVEGDFDLRDLESIDLSIIYYLYNVNIEKYDEFDIPDDVENLDLIDAEFIERSIDNGLVEWETIEDEMDNSIEEIEDNMPGMMDEVELTHSETDRSFERIRREYDESDFQPIITTDDHEVGIDNELAESLMNSGGIVDFEISGMDDEKYQDYSISMVLKTSEFMVLEDEDYEDNGHHEFNITIDPEEGYEGNFRAHPDKEVPTDQSVNLEATVDLNKVDLTIDLTASASTNIDGRAELSTIESTDEVEGDLPDYIDIDYLNSQLIRQIEKRDLLDRERILNVTREGEGVDDFDGMENALQDMLDEDEIEAETYFEEGTWDITDDETEPLVLLMESEFDLSLRNSQGSNAFEIYSMEMGEFDIPAIDGVDTNFRLIFPSGIEANVEETDEVSTGETGSRFYIEIERSGDSEGDLTISLEISIPLSILFSTDVTLNGIPFLVITLAIIALIVLVPVMIYRRRKKKKAVENEEVRDENVEPENGFERVEDSHDAPPPEDNYQESTVDNMDHSNSNFDEPTEDTDNAGDEFDETSSDDFSEEELEDDTQNKSEVPPPPPTSDSSYKTSTAEPSDLQKNEQIDSKKSESKMQKDRYDDFSEEKKAAINELTDIRGIYNSTAEKLYENGYRSIKDLERATKSELLDIEGIGPTTVEVILESLERIDR